MENANKKILITGAAGLVGQNLIVHLLAQGINNLVAIDKHVHNTEILRNLHPDIETITANLAYHGEWEKAFEGVDTILMLHAQIGGIHEEEFIANNVTATEHVIDAAEKNNVQYLVHISSSVLSSQAVDFYTKTKKAQEDLVLNCNIPHTVLRPTLMFGWFDRKHVGWLARFMKKSPIYPVPGDGKFMRQPLYAKDFCNIIMACMKNRPDQIAYNISGMERIDYIDFMRAVKQVTGAKTRIVKIPYSLFWWLLKIYSLFDRDPPFTTHQLEALVIPEEFEIIDWPNIFGIEQTPLDQALEETFNNTRYADIVLEF